MSSAPRSKPHELDICVTFVIATMIAAALFGGPRTLQAAEPGPVLIVPAGKMTLEVAITLPENMKLDSAGPWQLVEVDNPGVVSPAQLIPVTTADGLDTKEAKRLVAAIQPRDGAAGPRRFVLQPAKSPASDAAAGFRLDDVSDKSLGLWDGKQPVLVYNHGVITNESVPENDRRRNRACYVHPVYGLSGEVITDDFPRDHYHHHGICWTWPHIRIEGQEYDLWADRGIKQKFLRWLCREVGPLAGVIGVENGWFVGEKQVMIERVWLRAHKPVGESRSLDVELTFIPIEKPITLWGAPGKSYGGLTMRFAPPSRKDPNTVITVPSGRTTEDLKETALAWADFTSRFGDHPTTSGAAVFIDPGHPDYPPTWLTRHYGPLCVGWPGVKPKTFQPGEPIRLNYRIWIHKTVVETAQIQEAYDGYKAALEVKWE